MCAACCASQDGGANLDSRSAEELWGASQGCAGGLPHHSRAHGPAAGAGGARYRQATVGLQRKADFQRGQEAQARRTAGLSE